MTLSSSRAAGVHPLLVAAGLSVLLAAAGCSAGTTDDPSGGGGGGVGGGGAGGLGGSTPDCTAYASEAPPATDTELQVTNRLATAIYFQQGYDVAERSLLVKLDGATVRSDDDAHSACVGSADGPGELSALALAPGATRILRWDRRILEHVSPPVGCFETFEHGADPAPLTDCSRLVEAPGGEYTVEVRAFSGLTCRQDSPACDCVPGADGSCQTQPLDGTTGPISATAVFQLSEAIVEVAFE